jgi:hypothetical protein
LKLLGTTLQDSFHKAKTERNSTLLKGIKKPDLSIRFL